MPGPIIELQNVSKEFEGNTVVKNVSMSIQSGEFVTMLGPSGSGKTTILRMIAGFEDITSGRILINGEEINGVPAYRRPVNTVFQQYALFPHLNVFDNIAFGLKLKKIPKKQIVERVQAALEMVRMERFIKARIRKLSGGQQQRVAIARAIVNQPKVLLLDEPLGALDMKLRREMQLELKRIHRDVGITFVYVTHDQEEAMAMSDRIGLIYLGDLVQFDAPEKIYASPATPFAAGFIGETNLMEALVSEDSGQNYSLESALFCLPVKHITRRLPIGDKVLISVRPESMRIVYDAHSTSEHIIRGSLVERVFVGAMVKTWVRLDSNLVVQCLENAMTAQPLEVGEEVAVTWNSDHMIIFPL